MTQTEIRRKNPRTDIVLKVEYDEPGDLLADYLTDLSRGGLFICTPVPFEIGKKINFFLSFPGLLAPIALAGIVRWRNEAQTGIPGKPTGVGVEFLFEDEQHRREIDALMEKCRTLDEPVAPTDKPFRVLLVEDNQFTHELFRHALKRFYRELPERGGLEIFSALDGGEAIEQLTRTPIDLAVVDYYLPVMDGAELIRRMRRDPAMAKTPIMVVSIGGEGVREEVIEAGADLYIDKPVMLKQLLNTLHILLAPREPGGNGV